MVVERQQLSLATDPLVQQASTPASHGRAGKVCLFSSWRCSRGEALVSGPAYVLGRCRSTQASLLALLYATDICVVGTPWTSKTVQETGVGSRPRRNLASPLSRSHENAGYLADPETALRSGSVPKALLYPLGFIPPSPSPSDLSYLPH